MMKPTELRIGNLVEWVFPNRESKGGRADWITDRKTCRIESVDSILVGVLKSSYGFDQIQPIPLTDQWLIDFGFTHNGGAGWKSPHSDLHFYWSLRNGFCPRFYETNTTDADKVIGVQYVHQLQNLYFALTGKELELKTK